MRAGTIRAHARTQSSISLSDHGADWVLFNASPDILTQIRAFPPLQPGRALRDTGIAAIILIDGQIDHTAGLLMLREGRPLVIHCTDTVREDLTFGNPIFRILEHYCGVNLQRIPIDNTAFAIRAVPQLEFRAIAVKSKAAPYSPHREQPHDGDNIGVSVTDTRNGRRLLYAPGLGEIEPHIWEAMKTADCVIIDGTFWTDGEMVSLGISMKHARDIGHLPQSGRGGMMEWLDRLPHSTRRILIHINNTNPILDEDSPQRN